MKKQTLRIFGAVLAVCCFLATSSALAGKMSGSRYSGMSSRGSAIKASPHPAMSGPVNYRRFSSGAQTISGQPPSAGSSRRTVSVLERSATLPSSQLQTVIREKENSGPGWVGTGLLVWLLSQHDLSSSDRAWVRQQINDAQQKGADIAQLPSAELSDVVFNWTYPPAFHPGDEAPISVTATVGMAQSPAAVSCVLNGKHSDLVGNAARLVWKPAREMTAVMRCEAAGLSDMRLLSTDGMHLTINSATQ